MSSAEKRASEAPLPPEDAASESYLSEDNAQYGERHEDSIAEERDVRVSGLAPAGTHAAESAHEAQPHHIDHDDPLADAFFRHPDKPVIDVWEETHTPRAMSRGSRRAMFASLGIFAVSVIAIGSYAAYHSLIMPAPVELGTSSGEQTAALLPTPLSAAPASPEPEPEATREPEAPPPTADTPLVGTAEAQPIAATAATPATPPTPPTPPASSTSTPQDTAPTLAAPAPREPSPEPKAAGAQLGDVAGAQLLATAAAERESAPSQAKVAVEAAEPEAAAPRAAAGGAPTYDELVDLGQLLTKKNRRVEASEAFRRALLQSPSGSAALSGLAFVYLNAEQNQQARDYAQRAVQVDTGNAEGWIVLGAALELLGDKLASQEAYKSCVAQGHGPYAAQCRQVVR